MRSQRVSLSVKAQEWLRLKNLEDAVSSPDIFDDLVELEYELAKKKDGKEIWELFDYFSNSRTESTYAEAFAVGLLENYLQKLPSTPPKLTNKSFSPASLEMLSIVDTGEFISDELAHFIENLVER